MNAPCRFRFHGTGGALFGQMFVGFLLMILTLGIYTPWFICKLTKWAHENTELVDDDGNWVRLTFRGSGGQLFGIYFVGMLLSFITLGIYSFWFIADLYRFFIENTTGETVDGEQVELKFAGTGGELFGKVFVGFLLTFVTCGIYSPWMVCSILEYIYNNTSILVDQQEMLTIQFVGTGGELFGIYIVGVILTFLTCGIYQFWFQVNLLKFTMGNTLITMKDDEEEVYRVHFTGTGGELFGIHLLGLILIPLTFGIYYFWFIVNLIRFQTEHLEIDFD
ncbi:MAG: hypothetical protein Tsb009_22970 [Planctomycetaceae bacterium]